MNLGDIPADFMGVSGGRAEPPVSKQVLTCLYAVGAVGSYSIVIALAAGTIVHINMVSAIHGS